VRRLVTLDESVRVIFHAVLVGSLYLLFSGHNQPGGGFVGGLVAGSAISLRYLAGGIEDVRSISRFQPWTILGTGLLTSCITALVPLLRGDPVLTSLGRDVEIPLMGTVYASTTMAFDIGVYLVVVGLIFMIFEAFGEDDDDSVTRPVTEPVDRDTA
jgi:multicomponent Na+:H+ antiporter subunit A